MHAAYTYIEDIRRLEACQAEVEQSDIPMTAMRVHTPLKVHAWAAALVEHPDQEFVKYILNGITVGFRIGFNHSPGYELRSARRNMQSAIDHSQVIDAYLQDECDKQRVAGPFCWTQVPGVHVSRFGVIPKKSRPGKWRLIIDLSHPKGGSVNDGIDPMLCSLMYTSVDSAANTITELGRGIQLAKLDIQSAYRIIPVHPADRWLLGMEGSGNVYIDNVLPFGLRSAPKVFNAVADALEWILYKQGITHVLHYLDDFLFLDPSITGGEESNVLSLALQTCEKLGVPIVPGKVKGPASVLDFLGIILDVEKMQLHLPPGKLDQLKCLVKQWLRRKSCTKRELLSLVGHLSHACKVIKPGRPFLRRLIELSTIAKELHHHNVATRSDLHWWKFFLEHWNGVGKMSALSKHPPEVMVTSDASGHWGCGAV